MDEAVLIRRNPRVQARRLAESGGAVLLHLDTAAYHGLNETGWLIWATVGEGARFGELVRAVGEQLEDSPPELDEDVSSFVAALVERDLLRAGAGEGSDPEDR